MTTQIVQRAPRRKPPKVPSGDLVLQPPPVLPAAGGRSWAQIMTILPMIAGSGAMALMMGGNGGGVLTYVTGGMFAASMLGTVGAQVLTQGGQPGKRELQGLRREYMRHLSEQRRAVRATIGDQRSALFYRHPDPNRLWSTASSPRLWERRGSDGDFGVVRIGLGPQDVATPLVIPDSGPLEQLEPTCAAALRRFIDSYAVVPELPVALALRGFSRVYLRGDGDRARSLVRAMLAQLAVFHSPDDLMIAVCTDAGNGAGWDWVKWLPHNLHPDDVDALGPARLVAPSVVELESTLDTLIGSRPRFSPVAPPVDGAHLVVVLDGAATAGSHHLMTEGGVEGVTLLDLSSPPPRAIDRATLVLDVDGKGRLVSTTTEQRQHVGVPDQLSTVEASVVARRLAPSRPSARTVGDQPLTSELGLAELLGLGDPFQVDVNRTWQPRPDRDRLRVPLGLGPDGIPVELDIKESAQDGMGPHGLLVGATGSGKSELLRTLVLSLAVTHSSETLNFVLVDFKGGATFTTMDRLPHTSAVITNLSDELPLVDRMLDAIGGELVRRQELLRAAGNYASQRDYEKARAAGVALDPLPSLLIICDEFSELLTAKPEFIDMFVQIGRVGRSLGVHLLLASQRLDEGRLRGLETHLSYRIGLRTFSAMESRVVLGAPDAYELPRSPGHGFLRAGTEDLVRFKAAYVSGVYHRSERPQSAPGQTRSRYALDFTSGRVDPPPEPAKPAVDPEEDGVLGDTLLDLLVERIEGRGPAAHPVWLPPLAEPPALSHLLPPLTAIQGKGLGVTDERLDGKLTALVGLVDLPFEQRRDPLALELSGSGGHLALIGGPQSGKSSLLRTLITSLALTHTPRQVQFYCLDFGGGTLTTLRDLPHVGGVATRRDTDRVRRTVAELTALLDQREQYFAAQSVDGMDTYRRARARGQHQTDPYGDVFLVIDNWLVFRNEFEDLSDAVADLTNRGLGYGIHVVAAATRWMDLRMNIRDLFGTKVELRLGDPSDSGIGRRPAANIPEDTPGRGITDEGRQFIAALPRLDDSSDVDTAADGAAQLVTAVRDAWGGPAAPPVRLLPELVTYDRLPAPADQQQRGVPVGLAETDLGPVYLDFAAEPHFLLFGDVESGKTSVLRTIVRGITDRYSPKQARILCLDYRRGLLGAVPDSHAAGSGATAKTSVPLVAGVVEVLAERLPTADMTAEQLRTRWWRGPEIFVVVDDYDLVAGGSVNPLSALLEYLPQARDIGLHLILAHRAGGASRALYEPAIAGLRQIASPGLVLSCPRDEGVLIGDVRPQTLPAGRGWLVQRRTGKRLVQTAWLDQPS